MPVTEIRARLAEMIAANDRPTKTGTAHGGQFVTAKQMDISHSALGQVVNGHANPGRKVLDYFNMESRVIYVPKTKNQ